MPTYVYETVPKDPTAKPRRFEIQQRMADSPLRRHPETGETVRRVISGGLGFLGVAERGVAHSGGASAAPDAHHCAPGCDH